MDPRSHGNSSKVLAGNSVAQQARDLRKVIEGLQLDRVTLVAWSMAVADRRPYLAQIKVPTLLVVAGENKEMGETLKGKIGGAQLSVFESVGHALFLEDPKKSNDRLAAFVKSLP